MILNIIFIIVLIEALTELAVKSEFFYPLRKVLFNLGKKNSIFKFIFNIFDCGYCFSVWASFLSLVLVFIVNNTIIDFILCVIVFHRLSNLLHFVIDRIDKEKDL